MSRYYEITVFPPATSSLPVETWTSYPGGKNDPGALNVQIDLLSGQYANPVGNSTVVIDGIPLNDLFQATQYAGMDITIKGGMQAGLPLANPTQNGLLLKGQVFQSWGNWQGTDMSISFSINPSQYTFPNPGNFVFNWAPGQSLAAALANTLNVAYPGLARIINIGSQYATSGGVHSTHYAHTLSQIAQYIKKLTQTSSAPGVDVAMLPDGTLFVSDGSVKTTAVQIAFTDLIGQPKWVDQNLLQFTTVMRADVQIGTYIRMPAGLTNSPGLIGTTAESLPGGQNLGPQYKTAFQGIFTIRGVRHVGNFRDPDGASWATIYQATPQSG